MLEFILGFLTSGIYGGSNTLNTKKIDQNIEKLKNYTWFNDIYIDEKYQRLFLINRKVREYLQSTTRVKRIIKKEKSRNKFLELLNKEVKK